MNKDKSQKNIPNGWSIKTLESLTPKGQKFGIVDGPFGSNLKIIHYQTQGVPIITSGYVTNGYFSADKYLYVTKEKFNQEKRSAVKGGDIVMAKIGARCGASAILPYNHQDGILSGNALKITIDETRYRTMYIWQILLSLYRNNKLYALRSVGAQPALSIASLKKYKILLPPLPEQNRIVTVLETWDKYLEKLSKKIEIKKNIKKGLMQKLLTGKVRLSGFNKDWGVLKLNNIGKTYPGITGKNKDDFGEGKPYISYMNIFANPRLSIKINDYVDIKDDEKQNKVEYGDLFFTTSSETPNEVGMSSVLLGKNVKDLYLNSFCFGFRLNHFKTIIPEFSQFYFRGQYFRKQMTRIAQGASRFNLSKRYFLETKITIPKDIKEQNAIAKILTTADQEIESLEKKKKIIEAQKKYLLNNLITGKIRVPVKI